jgi:hypothetical protein
MPKLILEKEKIIDISSDLLQEPNNIGTKIRQSILDPSSIPYSSTIPNSFKFIQNWPTQRLIPFKSIHFLRYW